MPNHLALYVDRIITDSTLENSCREDAYSALQPPLASLRRLNTKAGLSDVVDVAECRICQEEDEIGKLDAPCSCSGSLKYVHHKCAQRWCNEKGNIVCEICRQDFKGEYVVPTPARSHPMEHIHIEISRNWGIARSRQHGTQDLHILAMANRQHLLDDERRVANANSIACSRTVALIMMALLLLRHALSIPDPKNDDDISITFILFIMRGLCFFLPCYVMARAISMFQQRWQRHVLYTPDKIVAIDTGKVAMLLEVGRQPHIHVATLKKSYTKTPPLFFRGPLCGSHSHTIVKGGGISRRHVV